MKTLKRHYSAVLLLILTLLIAGCGIRSGVSWPDVTVIEGDDGEPNILVAYSSYVERVDLNGNSVFLRDANGEIRLDEEGRRREWEIRSGDANGDSNFYVTPIFIDDQTLVVPDYNDRLLIYDTTEEYVRLREGSRGVIELPGHVLASPVVYEPEDADRLLIVPITNHDVVAFNVDDSFVETWRLETERGVWAAPIIENDVLYIPGMDHRLYAVDPETGLELWRVDLGGAISSTPYFDGEALYVGTLTRGFYRIDVTNSYNDPQDRITAEYSTEGWIWGTPAFDGERFYFGDMNGYAYALGISGDGTGFLESWRRKASSNGIRPQPIVTDEYVIVVSRGGEIYWLDRRNGEQVTRQSIDAEILAAPVYIPATEDSNRPGLVVVATTDNDKVLVPFTEDGDRYTWIYNR